jgi:stage II sporulation protein M
MSFMTTLQNLYEHIVFFRRYLYISLVVFLASIFLGYFWAQTESEAVATFLDTLFENFTSIGTAGPVTLFLLIFLNNTVKTFFMMLLGILFGIAPLFFLFSNGFVIGVVVYALLQEMSITSVLIGLLPHGVIELPVLLLTAALGLWLGSRFSLYLRHKEPLTQPLRKVLYVYGYICIPLFFFAAFVEVFVTDPLLTIFS